MIAFIFPSLTPPPLSPSPTFPGENFYVPFSFQKWPSKPVPPQLFDASYAPVFHTIQRLFKDIKDLNSNLKTFKNLKDRYSTLCLLFIAESRKYHPVVVLLHNDKWLKKILTKFHHVLKHCSVFYLRYSVLRYFVKLPSLQCLATSVSDKCHLFVFICI